MFTISDMKKVCKFALKKYSRSSFIQERPIEFVSSTETIQIYFTNMVSAACLELPKTSLKVAVDCAFMPSEFLNHLQSSDNLALSYLRDIRQVDLFSEARTWNSNYSGFKNCDLSGAGAYSSFKYNARLISDAMRLMRQLGFDEIDIRADNKHPMTLTAIKDRSSIEFVIMPIVK